MHIAIVGSGPAGLTAAYRLRESGHTVEVLEALTVIGGRTHAQHFGPGHHCDTGAGWLATFYTHTLALFYELEYEKPFVRPRQIRGAADLLIDGKLVPWPFGRDAVTNSTLLTEADKARWVEYLADLKVIQPERLEPDLAFDRHSAEEEFAPLGHNLVEYMLRILFEGPWFARMNTMSAAMARTWLCALEDAHFFQVRGGMDAPWLKLAERLNVRTGERVEALRQGSQWVELTCSSGTRKYDAVVMAVPAPAATRIMATQSDLAPDWLDEVRYAPQVRVYAARRSSDDAQFGTHLLPPTALFSVEHFSGRHGAWGACPPDWEWGLACTFGATCASLLDLPADQVNQQLWDEARTIDPTLFTLEQADVVHSIRWEWAVPIFAPGHYSRLAAFQQSPPVVFAGDWMNNACVEGAVRSGEAAAAIILKK